MDERLYNPLEFYEKYAKDEHNKNVTEYFNELLAKSGINEAANKAELLCAVNYLEATGCQDPRALELYGAQLDREDGAPVLNIRCTAAAIDRPVMLRDTRTGEYYPRRICDIATSHLARRTFTQIAYAATGDQRLVSSMTGHAPNSRSFSRYSEVTRKMKTEALKALQ